MVAAPVTLVPGVDVKVNGTALDADTQDRLLEVVVEQSLHLPDMAVLRFHDIGDQQRPAMAVFFSLVDGSTFPIGAELEVELAQADAQATVFRGEITAVELEASEELLPVLTVRGYARSHRLHRNRRNRSFLAMTDSQIVEQVAQEGGLSAQVEATTTTHDYVLQYEQTDWEFLKHLAARNGYELLVADRVLHFRKPQNEQDSGLEQKLWESLIGVRVKLSTAFQADEVIVRAWDYQAKEAIVGTASSGGLAPKIGEGKTGAQLAGVFGNAKLYVVNQPVADQTAANTLAKAIYDELDGAFVEAEASCVGDPRIKAGLTLKLDALGTRLSGTYYLTSVVHTVRADQDYTTSFVVSGRRANTLSDYLLGRPGALGSPGQVSGVVTGVVTNITDPDDLGRVKVKLPWIGDEQESWWVRIASPMAGSSRGFLCLPEIDDEVLVAFEHGDVNRPYILGVLWNGQDQPPKKNSEVTGNGKVNQRILKTRAGHTITLDDTDGSEKITIVDKTESNKIEIDSSSNKITIEAAGDVSVTASGDATVKAVNAKVTADQNGSFTAQQKLTLEGLQEVSIHGAQVKIKADAAGEINGGGMLTVKGGVVNIN
jgi:uncharacterized protein involved in type VI secretion and phage assembly